MAIDGSGNVTISVDGVDTGAVMEPGGVPAPIPSTSVSVSYPYNYATEIQKILELEIWNKSLTAPEAAAVVANIADYYNI
jgi:hypothetical protein